MKVFIPLLISFILLYANVVQADYTPYTYKKMINDMHDIRNKFNDHVEMKSIGVSEQGRKIYALQLGKGEKNVLLIGSHHAREWITSEFLIKLLQYYAEMYEKKRNIGPYSSSIFDQISIIFIPMLNPDGVYIQQNGLEGESIVNKAKLISMNHLSLDFTRWKSNGLGIDLNRQYPADWGQLKKIPFWPSYKQYRGKEPVQAKEVRALVEFTNKLNPLLAIAYHTSGREVYWYYHTKKEYILRDYTLAEKIAYLTGYEQTFPDINAVGGGFTDWFITSFNRPGFTLEMCESVIETNPPRSCLQKEWEGNKLVPIMLLFELMKRIH
ncbi:MULTISPECIES: M14 family zinc carboxypeptidase [Bacillus]|uniref:M14 family zinc carboxypeptidase n=1 Tax=Bacillus TaxID=1386 RepID=UPI000307937A|nr:MULTISPECIES: M14 family zinc carboxypeptidase [Bacillus]